MPSAAAGGLGCCREEAFGCPAAASHSLPCRRYFCRAVCVWTALPERCVPRHTVAGAHWDQAWVEWCFRPSVRATACHHWTGPACTALGVLTSPLLPLRALAQCQQPLAAGRVQGAGSGLPGKFSLQRDSSKVFLQRLGCFFNVESSGSYSHFFLVQLLIYSRSFDTLRCSIFINRGWFLNHT